MIDRHLVARAMSPDIRFGSGLLPQLLSSLRGRFTLIAQPEPLAWLPAHLRRRAVAERIVTSLAREDLATLERDLPPCDAVVGIGGGMAMDAAKSVAWKRGLSLYLAPGIVSVDAPVTNTFAVRDAGRVVYEGFVVAEAIVVDFDLVRSAPARLNRAGVGDLLSIHTGLWDWRLGASRGKAVLEPEVAAASAAVLDRTEALAEDIATVSPAGVEGIVRAYAEVNALCLRVGHSQPEEGSEHFLAYHLEAIAGHGFVHGEVVGLGTVLMATLQGNRPDRARGILERCSVDWSPAGLGVTREQVAQALRELPAFVQEAGLTYSIINEADLSAAAVEGLLDEVLA
jgi:glycerol-1-phosphate dehydrogenase [NAD(P)+]